MRLSETRVETSAGGTIEGLRQGQYVRLVVEDTGHGMDENTIDRIFEPYFPTKEVGEGTGLGLATVLAIVEEHGGAVTVESTPGRGTAFEAHFPVLTGDDDISGGDDERETAPLGKGEHILFVDDEQPIVTAYRDILRAYGYAVTAVTGSTHALNAFRADPDGFDIVITDQTMPEMTGLDMAKAMLRIRAGIPILLCTGYSPQVDEAIVLGAGLRGYVSKPLQPAELARAIRLALD